MLSDGRESESSYNSGNAKMSEAEQKKAKDISDHEEDIMYSARYSDDHHEYRHVNLPREIARWVPQGRLMTEQEWRGLGVKQSPGWYHYMLHGPEPHILLFKRDK